MQKQKTSHTRYLQTFGTYVTYQPESGNWLPVQAAFYYQTGKNKNAQSVSAFMVSVKAAYAIDKQWSVSLGYDYLSGSDGQYDWFITQEILKGELTRAKAQHKRATEKVYFSHEASTIADAVYLCMVERRKRSSVVSVPDRYINEFLGWEL